jgi:hypothetical protein
LHRQMLRWDKKILDTIMDNIWIQCAVLIQDVRDRRLCDRIRCKDNTLTRNKIRAASKSAFGTEIAPDYYTECHDDANVSIKIMKQWSDTYSVVLFFDVDDESIPAEYISDEVTASRLLSFIKRVSCVSGRPLADCLCARR